MRLNKSRDHQRAQAEHILPIVPTVQETIQIVQPCNLVDEMVAGVDGIEKDDLEIEEEVGDEEEKHDREDEEEIIVVEEKQNKDKTLCKRGNQFLRVLIWKP